MVTTESSAFVGMEVHKNTIAVALADGARGGEVRFWGSIPNETASINRLVKKSSAKSPEPHFAYEAGPCGYGLHRHLSGMGYDCQVAAPSLTPVQPGRRRIKNDANDALSLARLHRAEELTYIRMPASTHEAMQDLIRARRTASHQVRKARQRISCFLLKHGRRYEAKKWGYRHRVWLSDLQFEHAATAWSWSSPGLMDTFRLKKESVFHAENEKHVPCGIQGAIGCAGARWSERREPGSRV